MKINRYKVNAGDKVRVHRNLNTGAWAISIKIPGKGWSVANNQIKECSISNATPITSEKGAVRIQSKGHREVIAKIEGTFIGLHCEPISDAATVHYNPFKSSDFHWNNGDVFTGSNIVSFHKGAFHAVAERI